MALRELFNEAADAVVASPTESLTSVVSRRLRRRKVLKVAGTGALSVAVVGAFGAGYLSLRPVPPKPLPPVGSAAVALRTDRALARGQYITPKCGARTCVPVLTTVDGRRYVLPGPTMKRNQELRGVGLSPDGRWAVYNRGGGAVLRDLTGTTTYRVRGSGELGGVYGWSSNGRWALIQAGFRTKDGGSGISNVPIRVDLKTGQQIAAKTPRFHNVPGSFTSSAYGSQIAVLPSGDLLIGQAGPKPHGQPHGSDPSQPTVGPGIYHIVDPKTGKDRLQVRTDNAVHWSGSVETDGHGHSSVTWDAEMTDVHARSDGRYMVFSFVGDPVVQDSGLLMVADLSTGAVRTVDVTKLAGMAAHTEYAVQSYTSHALTLITSTERIVLDGNAERVLVVHKVPRSSQGAVLPGQLLSIG